MPLHRGEQTPLSPQTTDHDVVYGFIRPFVRDYPGEPVPEETFTQWWDELDENLIN